MNEVDSQLSTAILEANSIESNMENLSGLSPTHNDELEELYQLIGFIYGETYADRMRDFLEGETDDLQAYSYARALDKNYEHLINPFSIYEKFQEQNERIDKLEEKINRVMDLTGTY